MELRFISCSTNEHNENLVQRSAGLRPRIVAQVFQSYVTMSQSFSKKRLIFIQIVNIVLTLGNNILLLEPDSVVERLEVLLRYDVVGVEVEDVVEEVPELVLLEG